MSSALVHHVKSTTSASLVSSIYFDMVMEDTTSNNMTSASASSSSYRTGSSPLPPPANLVESSAESVDSFEESSKARQRPQTTLTWSSYQPRHNPTVTSTRRERSFSSVVNPYVLSRGYTTTHQRSSSAAVLDLDYSSFEAKAKRRSLSLSLIHI